MEFLSDVVRWFGGPANWSGASGIPARTLEHVWYSGLSVVIAAAVALPLGLVIGHTRRFELLIVSIANLWRALPSFAVLFFAFVVFLRLGFGAFTIWPTIVAMVFLAIPPILTNTYVGIQQVDADTVEAARGMGMTGWDVLRRIEMPLAAGLIVTGLRIAAVQVVATATLGAVVGAGGLGRFIIDGFAAGKDEQIFGGAVLVAVLAILTEVGFGALARVARPRGVGSPRAALRHPARAGRPDGEVAV